MLVFYFKFIIYCTSTVSLISSIFTFNFILSLKLPGRDSALETKLLVVVFVLCLCVLIMVLECHQVNLNLRILTTDVVNRLPVPPKDSVLLAALY